MKALFFSGLFLLITTFCYGQAKVKRFKGGNTLPKSGIWDFYDNRDNFEQRYDFDTDSLLDYVKREGVQSKIILGQDTIKQEIDQPALPIGGFSFFYRNIGPLLARISSASGPSVNGRWVIQFVVTEEGKIETPIVVKSPSESMNDLILDMVRQWTIRWIPARLNGQKVKYIFTLPLVLSLPGR